jgi:hypothetical protein
VVVFVDNSDARGTRAEPPRLGIWAVFPTYRVEDGHDAVVAVLGTGLAVLPHHTAFDPFVSGLRQVGADGQGELVLVERRPGRM